MTPPYLRRLGAAFAAGTLALALGAGTALAGSGGAGLGGGSGLPSGSGTASAGSSAGGRSGGGSLAGAGRSPAPARHPGGRHGSGGHSPSPSTPVHHVTGPAPAAGQLRITGAGDGHGVGMSQYGAEGYALHGFSDRQILAHYYSGTALGHVSPTQTVRVLLADGRASFSGASAAGSVALSPSQTYAVSAVGGELAVTIAATGRRVAALASPLTVTGAGELDTAGREYRGALQFSADGTGGVRTVDVVGLDDYVRGVVAAEMPSSWAPAALEAQAIAARTYAITTTVDGAGFDLYDDTRSQMFGGVAAETATSDAAVAATSGQIVTDGGAPAVTYFFASSGGYTESIQNAWPGSRPEPWLRAVPDPYDAAAGDPYHSWHVTLSLASATTKLGSLVHGTLRRIVVTRRGVSPRVMTAQVVGTRGTTAVTGAQLAAAFDVPSTWMSFTVG